MLVGATTATFPVVEHSAVPVQTLQVQQRLCQTAVPRLVHPNHAVHTLTPPHYWPATWTTTPVTHDGTLRPSPHPDRRRPASGRAPTQKVQPSPLLGRMQGEVIRSGRLVDV